MRAFTEPFTESFTESVPARSLPDQGAWSRDQGTRDLRDEVPIHLQTLRARRTAPIATSLPSSTPTMDGRFAAVIR